MRGEKGDFAGTCKRFFYFVALVLVTICVIVSLGVIVGSLLYFLTPLRYSGLSNLQIVAVGVLVVVGAPALTELIKKVVGYDVENKTKERRRKSQGHGNH